MLAHKMIIIVRIYTKRQLQYAIYDCQVASMVVTHVGIDIGVAKIVANIAAVCCQVVHIMAHGCQVRW